MQLTTEHKQILAVCLDAWNTSTMPETERVICFTWLINKYNETYGHTFNHQRLRKLCNQGYLKLLDTTSGRARRYYAVADTLKIEEAIKYLLVST